jgi:hypothetical protein
MHDRSRFPCEAGSYVGDSFWSSSRATWPFSVLEISSNSLVLNISALFSSRYEFPREAIQKLVLRPNRILAFLSLDTAHLQIIHNVLTYRVTSLWSRHNLCQ